ncbi:MAG TPA: ABC transporter ATP-binding protein [Gemmatimonadales bacterium]|jgi:lipoprotein-releasing system ATP-binding protein|nr:ABC transporter ATP-binding protein [Gemmatimonadales bacterium]
MTAILDARALRKTYRGGDNELVEVLNHVDLSVARGEVVAVVGASGAGKSTLLHLLGALEPPTAGEVFLDGVAYSTLSEAAKDTLRNRRLGFVFQFHHLLREFTALENVMMPLLIAGRPTAAAQSRAAELLAAVGLAGRLSHRPAQLSGGEQQRCAVARALVHDPEVLLADEPSGNLDHAHSGLLHDLLLNLARTLETALVVVTHNRLLAERADRVLLLENGLLHPSRTAEALP